MRTTKKFHSFLFNSVRGYNQNKYNSIEFRAPIFGSCGPITLPPILKPVANLCWREASGLRQLSLLGRIRIGILQIPLTQEPTRSLLKTMRLLLAIPYGSRQWEFLAHTILVNRSEWSTAQFLRLLIVRLHPHRLQLGM